MPTTIMVMNPAVNNGTVAIGRELQIPPYNGIVVEVPRGETWRQVAVKYKVRLIRCLKLTAAKKIPELSLFRG